jgi:hypothetical protein
MSHHTGNFVYARDDEYVPLAACFAFECAAFEVSCVHRLDQSDRSLPAACAAYSQDAHGGRLGGMHVVSFPFGTLGVCVESTSAAWTEPVPVDESSLCNIDHFPNFKTQDDLIGACGPGGRRPPSFEGARPLSGPARERAFKP